MEETRVLPKPLSSPAGRNWSNIVQNGWTWDFQLSGTGSRAGCGYEASLAFSDNYPFAAPKLTFVTLTPGAVVQYHPNANNDGEVCPDSFGIGSGWAPAIKIDKILTQIEETIVTPELTHALRAELGVQYTENRAAFNAAIQANIATQNTMASQLIADIARMRQ